MFEFKLQLVCFIVIMYITVLYVKNTLDKQIPCNKYFDAILIVAPWAVVFDGVTAWTVNHLEIIPNWLNLVFHALFFVTMNSLLSFIFVYMLSRTVMIESKKKLFKYLIPGIFVSIFVLCTINKLYYITGKTTNYSFGAAVIACYVSMLVHFIFILGLLLMKHRTIEKKKIVSIVSFIVIALGILVTQIFLPETLLTSAVPLLTIIGIYINFEDPSLRKLHRYNATMVTGFATLVENRDDNTGGHILRTQGYVKIILEEMQKHHEYNNVLTKDYIRNVIDAAPMHDIGKIATPDDILQKPGKLTDEEYETMKKHAAIGGDIIKKTFADLHHEEYLDIAYEVARFHHEKWNGRGYPDGLKEKEIPLHARIMAIADVFDAISSKRCYRDPMPIEKCFQIIKEGSGKDFDPDLVELFFEAKDRILDFYQKNMENL